MNRWKRAIETWFTGKEEQMVRQIADLVAVPSVGGESAGPCQPFGEGPAKALEVALLQAQAAGLRAENQGGYVLTADLNDCPDELHILAHLDVVAPGEGWDTDPYTLVQEGDLIYGRGVDDDKGPAVAAMMAMECVKALNVPLKRNVKLVLGTDEESGSRDIAHYYATVPYAPCSFSPDAEFPVINIEKGLYTPVITGQWEAQPELPQVVSLTGGIRINVVPRQAEAVIHKLTSCATTPLAVATGWVTGTEIEVVDIEGGVKITCTGRDAHASTPEEGTNAITALLCLLAQLPLADTASARAIHALSKMFPFKDHHGSALGIDLADEVSGRITVCPSLIQMDRTGFRCQFDARGAPLCHQGELLRCGGSGLQAPRVHRGGRNETGASGARRFQIRPGAFALLSGGDRQGGQVRCHRRRHLCPQHSWRRGLRRRRRGVRLPPPRRQRTSQSVCAHAGSPYLRQRHRRAVRRGGDLNANEIEQQNVRNRFGSGRFCAYSETTSYRQQGSTHVRRTLPKSIRYSRCANASPAANHFWGTGKSSQPLQRICQVI